MDISGATGANSDSHSYTTTVDDHGNLLKVVVNYNDGEGTGKEASSVTTGGITNRAPAFGNAAAERHVAENSEGGTTIGAPLVASDQDPGDTLSYSVFDGAEQGFEIGREDGQLVTTDDAVLDFEDSRHNRYELTGRVTDVFGATADIAVTVVVDDVAEAPELSGLEDVEQPEGVAGQLTSYVVEDPDIGELFRWTVEGVDGHFFSIAGGRLSLSEKKDFEEPVDADMGNDYEIEIVVADKDGIEARLAVVISVLNEDEDGAVSFDVETVSIGQPVTASLTDGDGVVAVDSWVWSRSDTGNDGSWVVITGADGPAYTPTLADSGQLLRAAVSYEDGHGANKSAFGITSDGVINRPPTFESVTYRRAVDENSVAGAEVGLPVAGEDDDAGDSLTHSLISGDTAAFTVDAATGQIRVSGNVELDAERRTAYSVELQVEDHTGSVATTTVDITVNDINEPPVFPVGPIERRSNAAMVVGTLLGEPVVAEGPGRGR